MSDCLDIDKLYYNARINLNFSYNEFLESTPKAILKLLQIKKESININNVSKKKDKDGNYLTDEQIKLCERFKVNSSEITFIDSSQI